jgi:hypothetical protein
MVIRIGAARVSMETVIRRAKQRAKIGPSRKAVDVMYWNSIRSLCHAASHELFHPEQEERHHRCYGRNGQQPTQLYARLNVFINEVCPLYKSLWRSGCEFFVLQQPYGLCLKVTIRPAMSLCEHSRSTENCTTYRELRVRNDLVSSANGGIKKYQCKVCVSQRLLI